jgi:hypothetical protein
MRHSAAANLRAARPAHPDDPRADNFIRSINAIEFRRVLARRRAGGSDPEQRLRRHCEERKRRSNPGAKCSMIAEFAPGLLRCARNDARASSPVLLLLQAARSNPYSECSVRTASSV